VAFLNQHRPLLIFCIEITLTGTELRGTLAVRLVRLVRYLLLAAGGELGRDIGGPPGRDIGGPLGRDIGGPLGLEY
jgi:hypothetical protein